MPGRDRCLDHAGHAGGDLGLQRRRQYQSTINSNGTITGIQSGLCLDVTGASTANGALAELWPCNGGSNRQWKLG